MASDANGYTRLGIVIGDVIGQPQLEDMSLALNTLLHRPDPLDGDEAMQVFNHLPAIHDKVLQSLKKGLVGNVSYLGQLVLEATHTLNAVVAQSAERSEEAPSASKVHRMVAAVEDRAALQALKAMFDVVVRDGQGNREAQGFILGAVDSLIDTTPTLKERIGAVFSGALVELVRSEAQEGLEIGDRRDHRHLRTASNALITGLKGCRANKEILAGAGGGNSSKEGTNYVAKAFAQTMLATSDVFLKMQCIELLFRMVLHRMDFLDGCEAIVGKDVVAAIQGLPRDSTLIKAIIAVVQQRQVFWEPLERRRAAFIYRVASVGTDAGAKVYTLPTDAYFGTQAVVLLDPRYNGDAITIPFHAIRSARFTKAHTHFVVRLFEVPVGLEGVVEAGTDGKDTLLLEMAHADIQRMKATPISRWVEAAIRRQREEKDRVERENQVVTKARDRRMSSELVNEKRPREESSTRRSARRSGARAQEQPDDDQALGDMIAVRASANPAHDRQVAASHHDPQYDSRPPKPRSTAAYALRFDILSSHDPPSNGPSDARRPLREMNPVVTVGAEGKHGKGPVRTVDAGDAAFDNAMEQLRHVVRSKVSKKRQAVDNIVADVLKDIQSAALAAQEENRREREVLEGEIEAELGALRQREEHQRVDIAKYVEELNNGLNAFQQTGAVVRDKIATAEIELSQVIIGSTHAEERELAAMKESVKVRVQQMEEQMNELVAASDPIKMLTEFMSKRMEEEA